VHTRSSNRKVRPEGQKKRREKNNNLRGGKNQGYYRKSRLTEIAKEGGVQETTESRSGTVQSLLFPLVRLQRPRLKGKKRNFRKGHFVLSRVTNQRGKKKVGKWVTSTPNERTKRLACVRGKGRRFSGLDRTTGSEVKTTGSEDSRTTEMKSGEKKNWSTTKKSRRAAKPARRMGIKRQFI